MVVEWEKYKFSECWKLLKDNALIRDGGKCRCCSKKTKLEMHHDNYPDIPENDCLENVRILCRDCHQLIHDYKNGSMDIKQIKKFLKTEDRLLNHKL